MRLGMVFHVAQKEILSTLRDRRAIISNLLIPFLILPVIMLGLPFMIVGLFQREAETVTNVAVLGLEYTPADLQAQLETQNLRLVEVTDPYAVVEAGEYPVALEVPEGFAAGLEAGTRTDLRLYSRNSNQRSQLLSARLQATINAYGQSIVAGRLTAAGLDPGILQPIAISSVDASTEAERASGALAWLIPFFILIWTLAGGQMTAIDATAGEKERGTLEVLLVAPVRRVEVVVGKFLATMLFGLTAALMAILGYVLGGLIVRNFLGDLFGEEASEIAGMMGGSLAIDLPSVLLLVISALLTAGLVASLLISITMFARSFKEAQTYIAPLSFVIILPVLALQFSDFLDLNNFIYLVPVLSSMLLMDDIVKGAATAIPVLLTWLSTVGFTTLLLDFAYRSFKREDVLFRT